MMFFCVHISESKLKLFCLIYLSRLSEDRVGDICNACVLLVKRWKKLPHGSKKNWNHVSDLSSLCWVSFFSLPDLEL